MYYCVIVFALFLCSHSSSHCQVIGSLLSKVWVLLKIPLRIAVSVHGTGAPHTSMPLFILLTSEGWKTYSNLVLWHGLELNHICTNIYFLIPILSWAFLESSCLHRQCFTLNYYYYIQTFPMNAPSRTQQVLCLFTDVDEVLNKQINVMTIVNLYIYIFIQIHYFKFLFSLGPSGN